MEEKNWIELVIEFLDGKKTYICAVMVGVTAVLYSQGMIDDLTRDILFSTFGVGTVMSIRKGMKKLEPKE